MSEDCTKTKLKHKQESQVREEIINGGKRLSFMVNNGGSPNEPGF